MLSSLISTHSKDPTVLLDAINFRQFVSVIARFRRVENPSQELIHRKLECELRGVGFRHSLLALPHIVVFRVFDTDRDGWISEMDVRNVRLFLLEFV